MEVFQSAIFPHIKTTSGFTCEMGMLGNADLQGNSKGNGNTAHLYVTEKKGEKNKLAANIDQGKLLASETSLSLKSWLILSESLSKCKARHSAPNLKKRE